MIMKRLVVFSISVIIVLVLGSFAFAEEWGGFTWSVKNGVLSIDGNGAVPSGGPWEKQCKSIKTLEIGKSVTSITNMPEMKKVTSVICHSEIALNNYTHQFQMNKGIKTVKFTGEKPQVDLSSFWASRLKELIFENPSVDYVWDGNLLFSKDHKVLYYYLDSGKGQVVIPEGVEVIAGGAFASSKVKAIQLPSTLVSIHNRAFEECKQLKSIVFPSALKIIGECAFNGSGLSDIQFLGETIWTNKDSNDWTVEGRAAFGGTLIKNIELPAFEYLPESVFTNCKHLESVIFREGSVLGAMQGRYAFGNCKKLKSIFIPDSMVDITYDFLSLLPSKCVIQCNKGSKIEKICQSYNVKYSIIQ